MSHIVLKTGDDFRRYHQCKKESYMGMVILFGYPYENKCCVWHFDGYRGFDTIEEAKKYIEEIKPEIEGGDKWWLRHLPTLGQTRSTTRKPTRE